MSTAVEYAPIALIEAAQAGDRIAAEELISRNGGLIQAVVSRFRHQTALSGLDGDDLWQLASIGLLKAIRQFDRTLDYRFSTYAVPKMVGEIRRFLRDDGPIKVSRGARETAMRIAAAQSALQHRLGREPTVSELAEATGLTPEELASQALQMPQVVSSDGETDPLAAIADPVPSEDRLLDRMAVSAALDRLPPRVRRILKLRYEHGLSQQKIAPLFGVSQVQISRLERNALRELKEALQ